MSAAVQLSPQAKAAIARALASPTKHMTLCVSWSDDNGDLWAGPLARAAMPADQAERHQTPEANVLQLRIERAIAYARRRGIPARIIVLKGRRSGSSLGCANVFNLECRRQKTQAVAMADQYDRSAEIFGMMSAFATSDVTPWGFGVKVSDTRIVYGNGSVVKKETALDKNAGRGAGNRLAWFSEAAHYPSDGDRDARTLMLATLNTIPQKVGTLVIAESTANGPEGWFPETWNAAEWPDDETYWQRWETAQTKKPDNLWIRVFAAWFEIPRNAIPCTPTEAKDIMARLSTSERQGVERYGWTPEQIKWRRNVVANNFSGDERTFDQEYPHSPDSAFLATGSPAFNRDSLAILRARAERAVDAWRWGVLEPQGASFADIIEGRTTDMRVQFRPTPAEEAWFGFIEPPTDGLSYILPVDPASERDVSDGKNDLDAMSCLVFRAAYTTEQEAVTVNVRPRLVARIAPEVMDTHPTADQTIYLISLISHWYGRCIIPVETNKGEWVISLAKRAALPLYRTRTSARDQRTEITSKLGFYTTEESRLAILKTLQSLTHGVEMETVAGDTVRDVGVDLEDLRLVQQMETFQRDKRGKYIAAPGKHDDDVLCTALGLHLIASATTYHAPRKRRRL